MWHPVRAWSRRSHVQFLPAQRAKAGDPRVCGLSDGWRFDTAMVYPPRTPRSSAPSRACCPGGAWRCWRAPRTCWPWPDHTTSHQPGRAPPPHQAHRTRRGRCPRPLRAARSPRASSPSWTCARSAHFGVPVGTVYEGHPRGKGAGGAPFRQAPDGRRGRGARADLGAARPGHGAPTHQVGVSAHVWAGARDRRARCPSSGAHRGTIVCLKGTTPYRWGHPKTRRSRRRVDVSSLTAQVPGHPLSATGGRGTAALLFTSRNGTPPSPANVANPLRRVLKRAGIEGAPAQGPPHNRHGDQQPRRRPPRRRAAHHRAALRPPQRDGPPDHRGRARAGIRARCKREWRVMHPRARVA